MRKLPFLIMFLILSFLTYGQNKQDFSDPVVWFKGEEVTINDGNHQTKQEVSDISKTILGLVNFNEACEFNGEDSYITLPYRLKENTQFSFIAVYHSTDNTEERKVWSTNSQKEILSTTKRVVNPKISTNFSANTQQYPLIHTVTQSYASKLVTSDANITIGNRNKQNDSMKPFKGFIPEFIVYDRVLGDKERQKIESYLALKYGITFKADYLNSDGEVIWNAKKNTNYAHHITGIGRDDTYGLFQKQSSSTSDPDFLTIGIQEIAATNKDNNSSIENDHYLIWGDNGKKLQTIDETSQSIKSLFNRNWLMTTRGGKAENLTTQIKLNINQIIIEEDQEVSLVIDSSDQGNFESNDVEYIPATKITTDGYAIFDNVNWDKDGSGSDVFTFYLGEIPSEDEKDDEVIQEFQNSGVAKAFTISPNPTSGNIDINVQLEKASAITIRIYDIQGKLYKEIIQKGDTLYQIKEMIEKAGIYLVELETPKGKTSKELIVN